MLMLLLYSSTVLIDTIINIFDELRREE